MIEGRTVQITDAGRVEVSRTPSHGILARVEVATTAVTTKVEPNGSVGVTVIRDGATIWQYEMGVPTTPVVSPSPPPGQPAVADENAELRKQAADVLSPPANRPRRGRPPKPPVEKRPSTAPTLAELAERQRRK